MGHKAQPCGNDQFFLLPQASSLEVRLLSIGLACGNRELKTEKAKILFFDLSFLNMNILLNYLGRT